MTLSRNVHLTLKSRLFDSPIVDWGVRTAGGVGVSFQDRNPKDGSLPYRPHLQYSGLREQACPPSSRLWAGLRRGGRAQGRSIIEAFRGITHLEGEKAKSALALGIRESSIEVNIKVKKEEHGEKVTLEFPK